MWGRFARACEPPHVSLSQLKLSLRWRNNLGEIEKIKMARVKNGQLSTQMLINKEESLKADSSGTRTLCCKAHFKSQRVFMPIFLCEPYKKSVRKGILVPILNVRNQRYPRL